jgi:hypothetical protein
VYTISAGYRSGVSDEQRQAIIGRTLEEYQAARKQLAALHAEAEYLGNYLSAAGDALRRRHSLWTVDFGISSGDVDLTKWPAADQLKRLVQEIFAGQAEKNKLAAILKDAGFEQPA